MNEAANPFDSQPVKAPPVDQTFNSGGTYDQQQSGIVQSAMGNASTYTPATRNVSPQGTVQGQVESILSRDGPLFARARAQALEAYNGRGLVNASMASEGALGAVIDRALPMAQQDANAYNQADADNMNARNQAGQFNAGERNTFGRQALDQSFQSRQAQIGREFQTSERVGTQNFQAGQAQANRDFTTSERLGSQQFQGTENDAQRQLQLRVQQLQETGMDRRQAETIAAQERSQASSQQFQAGENQANRTQQMEVLRQQHANTLEQMGYQNKLATAQVPATYAANISAQVMDRVNAVLADPNLDAEGKKNAVQNIVDYANTTLSLAEKLYGATLPRLSTPGQPAQAAPAAQTTSSIPETPTPMQAASAPAGGGLVAGARRGFDENGNV